MKDISIGIVGAAGRGRAFLAPVAHNPRASLTAVCDINEDAVRAIAESTGAQAFTSYEEMLDKARPDAVIVATPMHLHVPQSIAALQRGIHVLSEVTAAVSMDEAKELVEACRASKAKYMMAENACYMRPMVLVRELARAGLFGEMYYAEGEYLHCVQYLFTATPWRRKWQSGINGNTYCTHSLGPILQWMDDRVVSVSCVGSGHHYRDADGKAYEIEDTTLMQCRTEKGALVGIRLDLLSNRPHNLFYSLQGTDGCYEAPRGQGDQAKIWLRSKSDEVKWFPLEQMEDEYLPEEWRNPSEEMLQSGHDGSDYLMTQDFIETIAQDREPAIGLHEAMDMTLPGLVSQMSIEQGAAWLPVPNSRDW